jgi:glucokinase
MNLVGAVDIGGTKIAVGIVDSSGKIYQQEVCQTEPEKGFEDGIQRISSMLNLCLERQPDSRLLGIGVGCTGPVDPETGVLGPNSFLPLWEGVGMITRLEDIFSLPVAIENDADAAALGEAAWGAGQGASRCLYVTVSTGIGCGIVLDGQVYRGVDGSHPELGHLVIEASTGPVCFCGATGCWESLASGPALASWYNARCENQPAVDAREICRRAVQGEVLAAAAVEQEGMYLGIGLANLVTAFVPQVIVLGGGVMDSWPLFEGKVREMIRKNCGLVPHQKVELRLASLGSRTGLAGAAQVWFNRFGSKP